MLWLENRAIKKLILYVRKTVKEYIFKLVIYYQTITQLKENLKIY